MINVDYYDGKLDIKSDYPEVINYLKYRPSVLVSILSDLGVSVEKYMALTDKKEINKRLEEELRHLVPLWHIMEILGLE